MDGRLNYFQNLNSYLKTISGINTSRYSCVHSSVKPISIFTDYNSLKLPFIISGRLISVDYYKDANYGKVMLEANDLRSSMEDWVGIPIYTSHAVFEKVMRGDDVSVNEVVGKITKVKWNDNDPGIDFYAEIYDKNIAYKMANGVIKYISVGFARDIINKDGKYFFKNVEPKESSLVFSPRDKKALFKPV